MCAVRRSAAPMLSSSEEFDGAASVDDTEARRSLVEAQSFRLGDGGLVDEHPAQPQRAVQQQHAVVPAVGDQHVAVRVDGQVLGPVELLQDVPGAAEQPAEPAHDSAVRVQLAHLVHLPVTITSHQRSPYSTRTA